MKLLNAIWLFLLAFSAFAEEAEQPMETAGTTGIVIFFLFCIIGMVVFIYYFRKNAKLQAEKQKAKESSSS